MYRTDACIQRRLQMARFGVVPRQSSQGVRPGASFSPPAALKLVEIGPGCSILLVYCVFFLLRVNRWHENVRKHLSARPPGRDTPVVPTSCVWLSHLTPEPTVARGVGHGSGARACFWGFLKARTSSFFPTFLPRLAREQLLWYHPQPPLSRTEHRLTCILFRI